MTDEKLQTVTTDVIDGKYKLVSKLGFGATASVWKAKHEFGGFPVAIKIMNMTNADFKRCTEEFRTLSMVYHPNIVRTFDMGRHEPTKQVYLTMEYIAGSTWEALEPSDVSGPDAIGYLQQLVSVLGYLHLPDVRIIHKDIKPGNIVVSGDRAVLIDFNISSMQGHFVGTPAYKYPRVDEQLEWTRFADVWALALSFYELVTGVIVFKDIDSTLKVALDHEEKIKIPPSVMAAVRAIIGGAGEDVASGDYLGLFGLDDLPVERGDIPLEILQEFGISSKNQKFLAMAMLRQDDPTQPVSKSVICRRALAAASRPAGEAIMAKLRPVFSQLKSTGVVQYSGKAGAKARLTDAFLDRLASALD